MFVNLRVYRGLKPIPQRAVWLQVFVLPSEQHTRLHSFNQGNRSNLIG